MSDRKTIFWHLALLVLMTPLLYVRVLKGQFLFDDYQVIFTNAELWKVKNFHDCFSFTLKPSKPVTNFFIALGKILSEGVAGHRMLSILFHTGVVLQLYFLARLAVCKFGLQLSQHFSFWVALLFALAPIHSESVVVALFRMDVLGTFFTLAALLIGQSILHSPNVLRYLYLAICIGLAQLSKEVFAVITPAVVILFHCIRPWRTKLFTWICLTQVFWSVILYQRLKLDAVSQYPYGDVIGWKVLSINTQTKLAARAVLEGFYKVFTGHGLTVIRIADREGIGSSLSILLSVVLLIGCVACVVWLWRKGAFVRFWTGMAAAGIGIYLVIPNINIGSEHYWYFPASALFALLVYGLHQLYRRVFPNWEKMLWVTLMGYSICFAVLLEKRVGQMKTRLDFYLSELYTHPESVVPWNNVAVAIMESGHPQRFELAAPYLQKAKEIAPNYPNVRVTDFLFQANSGDKARADQSLRNLEKLFEGDPEKLDRYRKYFGLGRVDEKNGG